MHRAKKTKQNKTEIKEQSLCDMWLIISSSLKYM